MESANIVDHLLADEIQLLMAFGLFFAVFSLRCLIGSACKWAKELKGVCTIMKLKKLLLPFMAGALALGLAACGGDDKKKEDATEQEAGPTKEEQEAAEKYQAKLDEQKVDNDLTVAIVNDEVLKGEEYNAALSSVQGELQRMGADPTSEDSVEEVKTQTLDMIVNQTLILQKAKEAKIEVAQTEIDEEYDMYVAQFGDEEVMKEAFESQNIKLDDLKDRIKDSILFKKYQDEVTSVEEVTDEEVKEYYDLVAAESNGSEQELPPLKDVSEEIKEILEQNKQQEQLAVHVEELRENAKIELKI